MSDDVVSRSAKWTGGEFRVAEMAIGEPRAGEMRVKVTACMVCLTEVHAIDGHTAYPLAEVLGHEFVGVVEAVGPGVTGFDAGMTVASSGCHGGFADAVMSSAAGVVPFPSDVPVERGCFVEPLSSCLQAVRRADIPSGGTVLITGAGTNGLITLQLARRSGAARVIVSEPDPDRRALAREFGAHEVLDPIETPLVEALRGTHIDVAIETAGRPEAVRDGLAVVAYGGRVVLFGVNPTAAKLEIPLLDFHIRDISLLSSHGYTSQDVATAVSWLRELELEKLISHRFPLDDIASAFDLARSGSGLKAIVYPHLAPEAVPAEPGTLHGQDSAPS